MRSTTSNHVWLVGAGPGDPGLITVRGLELIRQAEVVVYDALANPALLAEAPAEAELIDAGKRAKQHRLTQDQTNALLVEKAKQGRRVVRLKGGDPYLFGRGAEEAIHLAKHGVSCEVVPGVTAGIAAPMFAGVPVTHREHASSVTFVTGHEDPSKGETTVDWSALAALVRGGGTLCVYMGVGRLRAISEALQRGGCDATTPVAAVQWGTLPRQRRVRTTLGEAVDAVAAAGVGAPAILVIGPVAGIDEPGLDFFERRPLFGQRVVVTRTRQQASALRRKLAALGAEVLEAPTIELREPSDFSAVDAAVRDIGSYDWLVLTSANGVAALASRLRVLRLDARRLAGVKVAAIGDATAAALREQLAITADLVPTRYVAESLAAELIAEHDVAGKRMLLLRADIARPALPKLLSEAGVAVTELVAYQTVQPAALPATVTEAFRDNAVDWITFTSSSTARHLAAMRGDIGLPAGTKLASIGPITSATMREIGLEPTVEAEQSNVDGLIDAIVAAMAAQ